MQACNTYKTSGVKVDLSNCDTFFFYILQGNNNDFIQDIYIRSTRPIVNIF